MTIIGNLTSDPISRTTQNGKQVCNFTVAVSRRRTNDNETDYFRVSAWGGLAENCNRYLVKGKKVAVIGQVSVSTYKASNGDLRANLDVFAESVEFLSPAEKTAQNAPQGPLQANEYIVVDEKPPF